MAFGTRQPPRRSELPASPPPPAAQPRRFGSAAIWLLALLAAALLAWLVFAILDENESGGPEAGASVSEIVDDPREFIGETVTVSGEIASVLSPRVLTIGGDEFVGGGELLVVASSDVPLQEVVGDGLERDDLVQVTGEVRSFDVVEVEQAARADLADEALAAWEDRVAIVAQTLVVTPRAQDDAQNAAASAADIARNPSEFHGDMVTVRSEITEVFAPNAFVLDGEVLVVAEENETVPDVREDQRVDVTGTVREREESPLENELRGDVAKRMASDWSGGVIVPPPSSPSRTKGSSRSEIGGRGTSGRRSRLSAK